MSDLIERLRQCWCDDGPAIVEEAADRIAELEAANAKMRKCLEAIAEHHESQCNTSAVYQHMCATAYHTERRDFAREAMK